MVMVFPVYIQEFFGEHEERSGGEWICFAQKAGTSRNASRALAIAS